MRIACSTGSTKTFPSPILPVLAAPTTAADGFVDHVVGHHDFDFHFRQEIDGVFAAAIDFSVAFLAAEAFYFGHGHAFDPELGQGFLDLLEFERLDDRFQFFHLASPRSYSHQGLTRGTRFLNNAFVRLQTRNFFCVPLSLLLFENDNSPAF